MAGLVPGVSDLGLLDAYRGPYQDGELSPGSRTFRSSAGDPPLTDRHLSPARGNNWAKEVADERTQAKPKTTPVHSRSYGARAPVDQDPGGLATKRRLGFPVLPKASALQETPTTSYRPGTRRLHAGVAGGERPGQAREHGDPGRLRQRTSAPPQAGWRPLAPNPCGATGLLALAGVSAGLAEGSVEAGILWMTLFAPVADPRLL
jgi:hypothetical protein